MSTNDKIIIYVCMIQETKIQNLKEDFVFLMGWKGCGMDVEACDRQFLWASYHVERRYVRSQLYFFPKDLWELTVLRRD